MAVVLPTGESNSGTNDWSDVFGNDKALKEAVETLETEFAASAKPVTWYTPKAIATEQSRENTEYGYLTTEDKIESVIVPENGVVRVWYSALWKESGSDKARAAIFIGSNQMKVPIRGGVPVVQEARGSKVAEYPSKFRPLVSSRVGLVSETGHESTDSSFVTTGMALALPAVEGEYIASGNKLIDTPGGAVDIFRLAAGTYTIGVKFKASSGSVTAKERLLQVAVLG